MLRCAITDRTLFPGDESQKQDALVRQAALWAHRGLDLIQLREKDLNPAELAQLASRILSVITAASSPSRLLLNAPSEAIVRIAVELHAHGVHLPSDTPVTPAQVRHLYAEAQLPRPTVSISCHTLVEVDRIREQNADALLFSPIFGKSVAGKLVSPGIGLRMLEEACSMAAPTAVYALGGITTQENASRCLAAGARGVAGIRLFLG